MQCRDHLSMSEVRGGGMHYCGLQQSEFWWSVRDGHQLQQVRGCKQAARELSQGGSTMRHLTGSMIANAINQVGMRFDCHDVERRLLRDHSVATANEIIAQYRSGDPVRYFSAVLSKYIDTAFRSQLWKLSKVVTSNLGGKRSKNQQWEKRAGIVAAPGRTTPVPARR